MNDIQATERTKLRRLPERASYDRELIHSILDEAFLCHVGFVDDGQPFVIPTAMARDGDHVLLHGSAGSRMLRLAVRGAPLCITVTLLDALVVARAAFHHSMNYRSVVILGQATEITDDDEKRAALETLTDHIIPGRWADSRLPNEGEYRQTRVVRVPLTEVSAKLRTGPPGDEEEDYALPIWAGLLPLPPTAQAPIPDPKLGHDLPPPDYLLEYDRLRREAR